MARKTVNPVAIWRAYAGLGMLAFEAQAVIGMRVLGMSGAWPVGKNENEKMLAENRRRLHGLQQQLHKRRSPVAHPSRLSPQPSNR